MQNPPMIREKSISPGELRHAHPLNTKVMAGGHTMSQKEPHGKELFNTNNATPATHGLTMQSYLTP